MELKINSGVPTYGGGRVEALLLATGRAVVFGHLTACDHLSVLRNLQ